MDVTVAAFAKSRHRSHKDTTAVLYSTVCERRESVLLHAQTYYTVS